MKNYNLAEMFYDLEFYGGLKTVPLDTKEEVQRLKQAVYQRNSRQMFKVTANAKKSKSGGFVVCLTARFDNLKKLLDEARNLDDPDVLSIV